MKNEHKQTDERPKLRRVFFALWPDESVRKQLNQAFQDSPYFSHTRGRRYKQHNLHITLHFLGNVTEDQLNCARQQAATIKATRFVLLMNHFGRFKRARVLWLAPANVPDQVTRLYTQLGEALTLCDFRIETRPYQPHVTLMRKFHDRVEENEIEPIEWQVDRFALIESVPVEGGVEYQPLEFYNLEG